jgi:superfamily II DNA or RNA helicase
MDSKVIVLHKQCKVFEEDIDFLLKLNKHLSFTVQGAEHTQAYKGYFNAGGDFVRWDGMKRLLSANGTFSSGLLDRVLKFYKKNKKPLIVEDRREYTEINKIEIEDRLKELNKLPRDYQIRAVEAALKHPIGVLKMCTGAGKTLVAALITAAYGKKTIIHVIGTELLYQFHKLFEDIFQREIGIVGDGNCVIKDITIASIWTTSQALGMKKNIFLLEGDDSDEKAVRREKYNDIKIMLKEAKLHILDECHISAAETIVQIHKAINPEYLYGMSGTPIREDGQDLMIEAFIGKPIVDVSASELIDKKFLAKPFIRFKHVPYYPEPLQRNYQTVYKKYILENEVRNNMIMRSTKDLVEKGYQTLVLFTKIKHGELLLKLFRENGIDCEMLNGSDNQEIRTNIKNKLLNNELKCVIASKIFDIGVDIPTLSGLVLAGPSKSEILAKQRVGRVIRMSPGKTYAAIQDFYDHAPFLDKHSKRRFDIYSSEKGFDVKILQADKIS